MPSGQRQSPKSPRREHRHHHSHHYTDSPSSRRRRPSDIEARALDSPQSPTRRLRRDHASPTVASPPIRARDDDPMVGQSNHAELGRKRSLIRPERNRISKDHPNYQYRRKAQNMPIYPSTTGNDPYFDGDVDAETESSASTDLRAQTGRYDHRRQNSAPEKSETDVKTKDDGKRVQQTISKKGTRVIEKEKKETKHHPSYDRPPSFWQAYCRAITLWAPNIILKWFGKVAKPQQRAWREKMGLLSIIVMIMAFVGYLTFGFTQSVCSDGGGPRLRINKVTAGFMIFHGLAYDLSESRHPLARGVSENSNVLFDGDEKQGGRDGSFLFQNVNGACKGLITATEDSDIPTNDEDEMGWYFPCRPFNQDGSTPPNTTEPFYSGWSCHTSRDGRETFYDLDPYGEVYFTWDDIRNDSRTLMVWGGNVLDLALIDWFNTSAVEYPSKFDDLRTDPSIRGTDVTALFATSSDRRIGQCLSEIIKVGSIDTDTIGCIASKVVLYVSLVFILSIVFAKFILALSFEWFLSRKFAPPKLRGAGAKKKRQRQIEEWSDDIYRPPPKFGEPGSSYDRNGGNKRASFFPTTSRFTSPYAMDRSSKYRPPPTTMASQNSSARLLGSNSMYRNSNVSLGTLSTPLDAGGMHSYTDSRGSLMIPQSSGSMGPSQRYLSVVGDFDGPGPAGFIHEAVVPQPPPEWQPFGYPLGHAICLVTAYSEGAAGLRTTLDSIATTDYPNSHKLIMVICDGMIKGKGEDFTTPDICLGMVKDHALLPDEVEAFSYVAVASGSKRHNMAKIYAGFYDYGDRSQVPVDKQQRVPMMVVVKCGTPDEGAATSKPGNRGKRDSQIILMSFLQKVMFDERMTELEFEMFNGIWKITGISPDYYEVVLMVDADTKVFPDSLTHMVSAMVKDPEIMGLCGETKIANKSESWVSRIQVFEYFVSHHLSKSFESVFGGVTCLPGCFCMYRIKTPKGDQNYWVPILANPDIVEHYSENVVDTLHKKNLLLLGEDRYLSTLMLKTFPKRKQIFVPQAVCKTTVPDKFSVLLSQRRRWINSTVHNLMELVLVRDLCGTFCFSMQFVVFIELVGTLVLPAAISFTIYLISISLKAAIENTEAPVIPLILLALILGLPGFLIVITAHSLTYVYWMCLYLISLPIWNFVLPMYAYWKFDDFSWGDTRKTAGEKTKKAGIEYEGEFDSSKITMKRWGDFEHDRRLRAPKSNGRVSTANVGGSSHGNGSGSGGWSQPSTMTNSRLSAAAWTQHHPQVKPSRPSYEPYDDE